MYESYFPTPGAERAMPVYLVDAGFHDQPAMRRESGFPSWQVLFGVRGAGALRHDGKDYALPAGTGFLLRPDAPHAYEPTEQPWDVYFLAFDGEAVGSLLGALGFTRGGMLYFTETQTAVRCLGEIFARTKSGAPPDGFALSSLVYAFLTALRASASFEPVGARTAHAAMLHPVLEYINAHLDRPLTLAALAKRIGVSEQYLCRLFTQCLGVRPFRYIALRRMEAARSLLVETGLPVQEIARRVGYGSASYFGEQFRRLGGMPPGEFRQLHR